MPPSSRAHPPATESHDPSRSLHLLPPARPRHSLLATWHLLSLDAPSVATLWTLFFARVYGIRLPWQSPAEMFLAVWMLYVADRLLDARHGPANGLEARHHFHQQHRSRLLIAFCIAAPVLMTLLHQLPAASLHLYTLLATLLAAWLLLIHTRPAAAHHRLPKELAVGVFFPAAVCIPTVANAPQLRLTLLPFALAFAALCTLNCLFVYRWEHKDTRSAHWTTASAIAHIRAMTVATIAGSLTLAGIAFTSSAKQALPAIAVALSSMLLLALDSHSLRFGRVTQRALADATLLTPLLLLPFLR